jgi:hypothetical protein
MTIFIVFLLFLFTKILCGQQQLHHTLKSNQPHHKKPIVIGGIFPQFTLNSRFYKVDVFQGHFKEALPRSTPFLQHYTLSADIQQATVSMSDTAYPMDVIQALCGVLIPKRVWAAFFCNDFSCQHFAKI